MYLEVVCSWCGKKMGNKKAAETDDPTLRITHSICLECNAKVMEETEEILQQNQQITI